MMKPQLTIIVLVSLASLYLLISYLIEKHWQPALGVLLPLAWVLTYRVHKSK